MLKRPFASFVLITFTMDVFFVKKIISALLILKIGRAYCGGHGVTVLPAIIPRLTTGSEKIQNRDYGLTKVNGAIGFLAGFRRNQQGELPSLRVTQIRRIRLTSPFVHNIAPRGCFSTTIAKLWTCVNINFQIASNTQSVCKFHRRACEL